ncbi:MAG: PP2C family protein-serine/threonine phosphatase [Candidatus Geothermarchaeales archaeon]
MSKHAVGYASHRGLVREVNEDRVAVLRLHVAGQRSETLYVLAVADGMGGHARGEVASELTLRGFVTKVVAELLHDRDGGLQETLREMVRLTNREVFDYAREHPECEGMGSTLTACVVKEGLVYGVHVGDSRAYLVGPTGIRTLTIDHTWVQSMMDRGEITEEEARVHPYRSVLTRVVGTHAEVDPEVFVVSPEGDDLVLLCSDGITSHLTEGEIRGASLGAAAPQQACDDIVSQSLERGGADNLSVIVAPAIPVAGNSSS